MPPREVGYLTGSGILESGGVGRLRPAMQREEPGGLLTSEIAIEDRWINTRQVDHHQRVQRVAESRVDVESQQPGIQLQVLSQQDRQPFPVGFRLRDEPIRVIDRS